METEQIGQFITEKEKLSNELEIVKKELRRMQELDTSKTLENIQKNNTNQIENFAKEIYQSYPG